MLILEKINFKLKTLTRDKYRLYILIKGSKQKDKTIIDIYLPSKYMKQKQN